MSQSIQLQVTQVGLEQSIAAAMRRVGNSSQINLGTNSRQINALSQPLGRITGQADEFSKSMAAANARVLAFGASAGIIAGVSSAMAGLLQSTIKVEKSLVEINSVLNKSSSELDKFGQDIFNVAKNTGKSFQEVADGALELARQGLNAEDTLARLNDALILSRLSGLDAAQSVEGLTAAFNSFQKSGITTAEILNKVVAISQKYAVSERDIIEGVKRSASVAQQAGVSFEELAALITAVQQTTARGGAVIGNSFKTIFARIQRKDVLSDLEGLGIGVTDLQGNILPALKILENLASKLDSFSQIEQADIAEKLGGVFQLDKLLAALRDLSSESSVAQGALEAAATAGNSAYQKNIVLNQTLASLLNKVSVSAEQLGAKLGEIGVTDSLKNVLGFFNNLLEGIQRILGEESGLGNIVRGLVKGLGSFLAGPGLALFAGIILKLSKDLVQFGFASLKAFFGIGKAAKEVQSVESAISQILAKNVNLQQQLFALEGNRAAQLRVITTALVEQEALLRRSAAISSGLAAPLYGAGVRADSSGLRIGNSAGGYMPAVAKESSSIKHGVGGARSGDKPVVIPNFSFGGGKKGTMIANTGEYIIPNFNGSGGSAVFNRNMVQSMGLPSGAKKINAAGGFVPNFAEKYNKTRTLEEARAYWKKAKKETAIAAFENPNTSENDLIGASETLAKAKSLTYDFDASKFQFGNGMGIGLVALQNEAAGSVGRGRLTSDNSNIQDKLNAIGVPNLSKVLESKFRERNLNPSLFQGVKADLLQAKPNIAFEKIKIGSVNDLKNQYSSETFKDFQQTVNRLFARPIADLGNIMFGPALGMVQSGGVEDKYIFGKDILGGIFESATQFYIKGADSLPSFQDGEANRNQRFDFPMANTEEAKRLNSLFFKNGGVGIAEAKLTANASTLNSIVAKGLDNPEVINQMKKQIASRNTFSAAKGFIPNFVDQKYVMETLARIKAGTSGFSKQEQETFLNKFGAKSTGRKMSIRDVYDKLDGEMGISQLIDRAYAQAGATASSEDVFKIFEKQTKANPNPLRSLVSQKGFFPNFANPLQDAIGREMASGVPASQIYLDKNSSLKNAMNPMGLMVANRRDEPAGGFQGINRARREGVNPMIYGAASGFVPNYATKIPDISGQVQKGLGSGTLFSKQVEDAINAFGKKAIAAGGNMDKLSKELEATLTVITQNAAASKAVADEAKKQAETIKSARQIAAQEAQAKRASIANQVLSDQSNKKLAKKLDKIYLEYNKSEKTTQDLQIAQAKAAAVLNKTSLGQRTQAAVVGSTASLASSRTAAQPGAANNRDMLGTIFAVQGALSVLTGATSDASGALAKYTNQISSSLGTITTFAFAAQGIKGLASEGSKLSGVLGKLGTAGLVASTAFEGFKLLRFALNEQSGANRMAAENAAKLAASAAEASIRLDELDPVSRQREEQFAKDILYNFGTGVYNEQGQYDPKNKRKGRGRGRIDFTALTSEEEINLEESIKQARLKGATEKTIKDIFLQNIPEIPTRYQGKQRVASADNVRKIQEKLGAIIDIDTEDVTSRLFENKSQNDLIKLREDQKAINDLALKEKINKTIITNLLDKQIKKNKDKANQEKQNNKDSEKTFQINLGRLQAEINLNKKLSDNKESIFSVEQNQKEALANIENDISLSENERLKAVAAINDGYGKTIAFLNEQEQKTKNIGEALISGLTGVAGITGNQIPEFADKIKLKALPEFDGQDINKYQKELQNVLKSDDLKLPQEAIKPLIEALSKAVVLNEEISDERERQITALEKEYDIQIKSISASSEKLSLEKQISAQIEGKNSEASFKIENRVLNNAYETLSINKEIEQIKRETSLNELQKAEQVYKLELKRRDLESAGIGISLEQNQLNIDQQLIREAREALKSSGKISADQLKSNLTIEDLQKLASVDTGASEEIKVAIANAQRQRDLAKKTAENQRAGLGDVVPDEIMRKVSEGFGGGMTAGVKALENQINTFEYDIGEKIPQMFSDNMSNAISKMIEGGESFSNVLRGAAYEFIKGINQANIQNLSNKFSNFLFKSDVGASSGIASIFGMASGGMINGGSGTKDDVPAMLMGGEYVVNKKAVSKYGAQFLESINNGTLTGYAKGGKVQAGPQGNFYTPGTFGQGAISGKKNLLDFATQTGTSGKFDQIINELGFQSIALEPESSRLSVSGMRNSPMFEATQSAKGQAFDLYLQQYNAEREARKQAKAQKKALTTQLLMLAGTAALSGIGKVAATGGNAAIASLGKGASFFEKIKAFGSGAIYGGSIGDGVMAGGLKNLFSGNFATAFRSGSVLDAISVKQSGYGKGVTMSSNIGMPDGIDVLKGSDPLPFLEPHEIDTSLFPPNAIGGMIPPTSGIDTVPAMLSGGEFVMNRSAVQGIGAPALQSMNSGGTSITSEETSKELNEKLLAKLDELINASGSAGNITINVAPSGQTTQETSQDPSAGRQQLARQIKDAVLQIINDEKRIGGSLRR